LPARSSLSRAKNVSFESRAGAADARCAAQSLWSFGNLATVSEAICAGFAPAMGYSFDHNTEPLATEMILIVGLPAFVWVTFDHFLINQCLGRVQVRIFSLRYSSSRNP